MSACTLSFLGSEHVNLFIKWFIMSFAEDLQTTIEENHITQQSQGF